MLIYFNSIALSNQDLAEDGIEFICYDTDKTTGRYWPKTDTNNDAFAYIENKLYNNIIESKEELPDQASHHLGYFINEDEETVYVYGTYDETSDHDEYEDDDYDDLDSE